MSKFWEAQGIMGPLSAVDFYQIGQQVVRQNFETFIVRHSDEKTKLLDAGCSTGVEGWRLYQQGFQGEYWGVDNNEKAIALARKNLEEFPVSFSVEDVAKLSFPDRHFDIVLLKDMIEHYKYYDAILNELVRVTKQYFILSTFIKPSDAPDQITPHADWGYLNRYNRSSLLGFVTSQGFTVRTLVVQGDDEVFLFERQT